MNTITKPELLKIIFPKLPEGADNPGKADCIQQVERRFTKCDKEYLNRVAAKLCMGWVLYNGAYIKPEDAGKDEYYIVFYDYLSLSNNRERAHELWWNPCENSSQFDELVMETRNATEKMIGKYPADGVGWEFFEDMDADPDTMQSLDNSAGVTKCIIAAIEHLFGQWEAADGEGSY